MDRVLYDRFVTVMFLGVVISTTFYDLKKRACVRAQHVRCLHQTLAQHVAFQPLLLLLLMNSSEVTWQPPR